MFRSLWIVGLGGGLGAVFRVLLSRLLPETLFSIPLSVLLINIIGCFAMGVFTTGLLGGFTTFSAFSLETGLLMEQKIPFSALVYVIVSVVIGFLARA